MKHVFSCAVLLLLFSCQPTLEVEGFNPEEWQNSLSSCTDSRVEMARLLVTHQNELLGSGETSIKALLGAPNEHELYLRTQKFFYYNLTPGDTCENVSKPLRLSILFDALDRAKEVMIIE